MQNNNIDFELDTFIQNLYHEVQSMVYADENGDSKENKFVTTQLLFRACIFKIS
jgi:hypothetical protein